MQKKIVSCGVLVLIVVAIHNLCGMGLGLLAAKYFILNIPRQQQSQLKSECRTADLLFPLCDCKFCDKPAGNTSGAIFSVWHNISGSVLRESEEKG